MYQNTGFYHDCFKILPFIKHISFNIIVYNLHNLNKTNCKSLTLTNFTFMWLCDQPNLTLTLCILGLFQLRIFPKNHMQRETKPISIKRLINKLLIKAITRKNPSVIWQLNKRIIGRVSSLNMNPTTCRRTFVRLRLVNLLRLTYGEDPR